MPLFSNEEDKSNSTVLLLKMLKIWIGPRNIGWTFKEPLSKTNSPTWKLSDIPWDPFLSHLEFVYNSTPQSAVGAAPFEIDTGFIPNEPLMDTGNESSVRNDTAVELTKKLQAITLRTWDYL